MFILVNTSERVFTIITARNTYVNDAGGGTHEGEKQIPYKEIFLFRIQLRYTEAR